jgi:hypothetical protein
VLAGALLFFPSMASCADDENTAAVRAAFVRLLEARSHTFELATSGNAFVSKQAGKTERGGWTTCTQHSSNGTFDFVFKGRRGAIKTAAGWETVEDFTNPARPRSLEDRRPMRSEYNLLREAKFPADLCITLLDKLTGLRRDGDVYRGEFKPETKEGTTITSALQVWLEKEYPSKLELRHQWASPNSKTNEMIMTVTFTGIGTTKVEVPAVGRARLER